MSLVPTKRNYAETKLNIRKASNCRHVSHVQEANRKPKPLNDLTCLIW
jgi:hypothetical protein